MTMSLFRGKDIDSKEWVEGSLVFNNIIIPNTNDNMFFPYMRATNCMTIENGRYIIRDSRLKFHIVDPETVGQFVELTDKNSKNIFSGDVCRNGERTYLICWLDNKCAWGCLNLKTYRKTPIYDVISRYGNNFEVIGNKYDISELPQDVSEFVLNAITPIPFQPVLKSDDEDFVNFELREG